MILKADVNVVLLDFKTSKGNEMISANEDGSYTILINSRLSYAGQLKAYEHAIKHIQQNDFEKDDVQKIEYETHADFMSMSANDFTEHLKKLKEERRRLQKRIKRDQERINYINEHCNMFNRTENQYPYEEDL